MLGSRTNFCIRLPITADGLLETRDGVSIDATMLFHNVSGPILRAIEFQNQVVDGLEALRLNHSFRVLIGIGPTDSLFLRPRDIPLCGDTARSQEITEGALSAALRGSPNKMRTCPCSTRLCGNQVQRLRPIPAFGEIDGLHWIGYRRLKNACSHFSSRG
jgi:hypothetical protein